MASLGQELKRERELRGISLQEISDSTRINLRFLQAIEEDKLDVIPGGFFVRAILRSYAKSIGIDENQVLNKYQEIYSFEEQLQYGESPERPKPRRRPLSELFNRQIVRLAGLAFAIVAILLALFLILPSGPKKKPPLASQSIQPAVQRDSPKPSPPPEAAPAAEKVRGLRLEMTFREETWLRIYADGQSVWDGTKVKGESLEVQAEREVRLNIGNAGGTELIINGRKARPLGPSGAVRMDILITLDNYGDFLIAEQEKTG